MKFCTRCGSRMIDERICRFCNALAHMGGNRRVPEKLPAGDLPAFTFRYNIPILGLLARERCESVPFSYVNGTLFEIRTYQDAAHSVHIKIWSQKDNPCLGSSDPIVGRESQPWIRNIVRLRLGSGAERSFVLTQVRSRAKAGNRIGLIFPTPIERALNPIYDYAAIAAVDYGTNDYTWSTTHPEIYAIRSRVPEDEDDAFTDSLACFLNGLCRRCLRVFGTRNRTAQGRNGVPVLHAEPLR